MAELLAIDLSGLFWRQWHATVDQEVSAAFQRTVEGVARLAADRPHVAVCLDFPPYFRKQIYPEYKAQRDKPEPVAVEQFRRVKHRLALDGFPMLQHEGFEADDIIAGLCAWAVNAGHSVTIASSDKDLAQLVEPGVRVMSTTDGTVYDVAGVEAKFGVPPHKMADFLALTGDKSDNVPGVPGVGPKKASALLARHGTITGIIEALIRDDSEGTPPAVWRALNEHREQMALSLRLVQLRTDAPIDYEEIMQPRKPQQLTDVTDADFEDVSDPGEPVDFDDPAISGPTQPLQEDDMGAAEKKDEQPEQQRAKPITTLAKTQPAEWSLALEPTNSQSAIAVAKKLIDSRLFGQWGTPDAALAVILRGRELGVGCTSSLMLFHNIKNKLAMHADLIAGLVLRSPKCEYFECSELTSDHATWIAKRRGGKREISVTFTIEDAWRSGVVEKLPDGTFRGVSKSGDPSAWDKTRATMLSHRAKTQLARLVWPDVVSGLYDPDELEGAA